MKGPLEAALAAIDQNAGEEMSQQIIAAKCRGLIRGYHARWQNAGYITIAVEEMVFSDLWNPETQRKSRTFRIGGKKDVLALRNGRTVLFDHKTTSDDISDPASPYWRQLVVEAQPSHYMLLEWLNGRKVDEAVWDVVRKPAISPKTIAAKKEIDEIRRTRHYFGQELTDASLEYLRNTAREDLEMYEARLAHDCTVERPGWYFQRRTVPRLDSDIHEYATELWEHGQEVLHARNENRHARNSGACMLYKSPCKFLGICSGYDTPDSDKWTRKAQVHSELDILDSDGRDVLTNSRIRCFQTCRRKHYLQYELGIERVDEEEREALYFGTLWHHAQAAWFLCFTQKGDVNVNDNDTAPEIGFGTGIANNNEAPVNC